MLLDTHAFLWWVTDDPRLSISARLIIANTENTIFVSPASAWEIATKYRLGKLGEAAGSYPATHRDPFDRMLAAQSEIERLPLITRDPAFSVFGIETRW